jgi:hypothetical protein
MMLLDEIEQFACLLSGGLLRHWLKETPCEELYDCLKE